MLSMIRLVAQFFRQGLASRAAMSAMITILSLLLAFPTIAGSMTGYTTFNDPYMTSSSGKLFPFDDVRPAAYIIHDGKRTSEFNDGHVVYWIGGKWK